MTTKELLYVEDALGHEQYFITQCRETASRLQDGELRNYVNRMGKEHQEIYKKLYELL